MVTSGFFAKYGMERSFQRGFFWMASQEGRWEEKQERVALSCERAVWGQAAHSESGNKRLSVIGKLDSFCWLQFIWATYRSNIVFCSRKSLSQPVTPEWEEIHTHPSDSFSCSHLCYIAGTSELWTAVVTRESVKWLVCLDVKGSNSFFARLGGNARDTDVKQLEFVVCCQTFQLNVLFFFKLFAHKIIWPGSSLRCNWPFPSSFIPFNIIISEFAKGQVGRFKNLWTVIGVLAVSTGLDKNPEYVQSETRPRPSCLEKLSRY